VTGKQENNQLVGDVLVGQAFLGERIGGRDQCPHQARIFGGISSTLLQDVVGKTVKCRACWAGALASERTLGASSNAITCEHRLTSRS
jgi:hypothetical protein